MSKSEENERLRKENAELVEALQSIHDEAADGTASITLTYIRDRAIAALRIVGAWKEGE